MGEIKLLAASVPSLWHLAQVCRVDVLQSTVREIRLQAASVPSRCTSIDCKLQAASVPALEK